MPHCVHFAVFHLGLHYLAKYSIHLVVTSSQRVKDLVFTPQLHFSFVTFYGTFYKIWNIVLKLG